MTESTPATGVRKSSKTRRMSLADVPWWMVIILIVGTIIGYSVLTETTYQDVMRFLLGLPWNKELVATAKRQEDGAWEFKSTALGPGNYRLYGQFLDEAGEPLGRTETYLLRVPRQVEKVLIKPLPAPPASVMEEEIVALVQEAMDTAGEDVEKIGFTDDLTLLGTLRKMWGSNGVFLTIKITLLAFSAALVLGLLFGLGRVAPRNPDLTVGLVRRLLAGLAIAVILTSIQQPLVWRTGEPGVWIVRFLLVLLGSGLIWGLRLVASRYPDLSPRLVWRLQIGLAIVLGLILVQPMLAKETASRFLLTLLGVEVVLFLAPVLPYTISTIYVEVVRGIPLLVTILYMGYVITPQLRSSTGGQINLQGLPAATIGLAFGYGAYLAEVYRAGIESIHRGQTEAARSLGMSYFQAMRYVILPQAMRRILPPLGNNLIAMLKDSSLIAVIALPDLLQLGRLYISRTFRAFEGYNSVALLYLVLTLCLSFLVRLIERRWSID